MQIDDIFIVPKGAGLEIHPVALLLPAMDSEQFAKFKEDISGNGVIEPIILWQGKVLDGRHRYLASQELDIDINARKWEGGMDPVEYVVSKNLHRRHLTAGQRAICAAKALNYHSEEAKERQREAGGDHGNQYTGGKVAVSANLQQPAGEKQPYASNQNDNKATTKAGKIFNVSGRSVASAKKILEEGTEEDINNIETGKESLASVDAKVKERVNNAPRPAGKQTFNKTTESIDWAKWSWNPVTGCKHGCEYCYMPDIIKRFPEGFPNGFEPVFCPERLSAPQNTKLPLSIDHGKRNVFVCSAADLFGDWVPQEWIDQVIEACLKAPDWTFIFLTKNPKRLVGIEWPENAWVGTTVDCQARVAGAVEAFQALNSIDYRPVVTFLSCEPMNERLDFGTEGLIPFDWVIIGGRSSTSGAPAFQPEWEWVESLHNAARAAGCKIYWKPNLKTRPTEYPVD